MWSGLHNRNMLCFRNEYWDFLLPIKRSVKINKPSWLPYWTYLIFIVLFWTPTLPSIILVENAVFFNQTNITTNIETAVLSNQLFNLRMCVTASRIWLGLNLPVRGEVSGVRISYLQALLSQRWRFLIITVWGTCRKVVGMQSQHVSL